MTDIRTVEQTVRGYQTSDGAGVKLTRVIDTRLARLFDPFLMLDEFRSDQPGDYIAGFPPHPHRGFETVTYMMAGRMKHGDNKGNVGDLAAGSVQWMTAARGIVHEERPQQEEGLMWGYQLWVNLPAAHKMDEPAYQDIPPERIPEVALDGGGRVRVIAGEYGGVRGPVRPRPSEPLYLDVDLPAAARFEVTPPAGHTVVVMGVAGSVRVGTGGQALDARELALLSRSGAVTLATDTAPGRALVIAGRPFGEPIAHYGPFVMNTDAELRQAVEDFRAGRF